MTWAAGMAPSAATAAVPLLLAALACLPEPAEALAGDTTGVLSECRNRGHSTGRHGGTGNTPQRDRAGPGTIHGNTRQLSDLSMEDMEMVMGGG